MTKFLYISFAGGFLIILLLLLKNILLHINHIYEPNLYGNEIYWKGALLPDLSLSLKIRIHFLMVLEMMVLHKSDDQKKDSASLI